MRKLIIVTTILTSLLLAPTAFASPGDPVHSTDVETEWSSWKEKTWAHFGNWERGEVSAESWVDLHWPCFGATDEDDDCALEDVRGHGLVRKLSKVLRTQIDYDRLGRYPSGTLAFVGTNLNSGTLPLIERKTPWVPTEQFCGDASFRAWNRVTFDVRWTDYYLSKGVTLLSDPTAELVADVCGTTTMTPSDRQAARARILNS